MPNRNQNRPAKHEHDDRRVPYGVHVPLDASPTRANLRSIERQSNMRPPLHNGIMNRKNIDNPVIIEHEEYA